MLISALLPLWSSLISSYPHQPHMNSLWSVYPFVCSLHICWSKISVCLLFAFTLCNPQKTSKHQRFSRFYTTKKHPISRVLLRADRQIRTADLILTNYTEVCFSLSGITIVFISKPAWTLDLTQAIALACNNLSRRFFYYFSLCVCTSVCTFRADIFADSLR